MKREKMKIKKNTPENHVRVMNVSLSPYFFILEKRVCRGIPIFLILVKNID